MSTKTETLRRTEELVHMHVDAFNERNLEKGERNVTPDFEWTVLPFDRTFHGPKGYLECNQLWIDGFPDGKMKVKRVIAQGDVAVLEFDGKGTNTGSLQGPQGKIAPSGRELEMPFVEVYEFKDDKLHRGRTYFDAATMMRMLGK
jgi:predicted ester cyclase